MKIVADQKIPYIDLAFGTFGTLLRPESGAIDNTVVCDADALIVRSETKVDEKLLTGSKVSFVGTATIGTDHVDTDFLNKRGISFTSAPGCNSFAVMQYIAAVLFTTAKRNSFELAGKSLGVIGVGNVGSKIVRVAKAMGMNVLENDPPLARSTGDPRFVSLDDLMGADFISVHVPFTRAGADPTFHLFDEKKISAMKPGSILINSSRGGVVDGNALKKALKVGHLAATVLDVWEHEPNIDLELLSLCAIGTPHIAGYSIDGKVNATRMIYQAFCAHFNFPQMWDASNIVPPPKNPVITIDENASNEVIVSRIVKQCYNIEKDDENLREISSIPAEERGRFFKQLRGSYNFRHEFSQFTVVLQTENPSLRDMLKSFGLKIRYKGDGRD
jgi:erythronate-4-phosphate dehydrogenase